LQVYFEYTQSQLQISAKFTLVSLEVTIGYTSEVWPSVIVPVGNEDYLMGLAVAKKPKPDAEVAPEKPFMVRLPPALKPPLKEVAKRHHRDVTKEVIVAIEAWLKQHKGDGAS